MSLQPFATRLVEKGLITEDRVRECEGNRAALPESPRHVQHRVAVIETGVRVEGETCGVLA